MRVRPRPLMLAIGATGMSLICLHGFITSYWNNLRPPFSIEGVSRQYSISPEDIRLAYYNRTERRSVHSDIKFMSSATEHNLRLEKKPPSGNRLYHLNFVFWNRFHNYMQRWWHIKSYRVTRKCGNCSCMFHYDKRLVANVDAILFDYNNDLIKLNPELHLNVPEIRKPEQYWILYNHEPEDKERSSILFETMKGGAFNLSATYKDNSDIVLKYGKCGPRTKRNYTTEGVNFAANKTGVVVWLVSNCVTTSGRIEYAEELQKHVSVDIAGKCGDPKLSDLFGAVNYSSPGDALNRYKFYLAFENAFCEQYITEKVFKILRDDIRVVPIVRGAGPYEDVLPAGSYINAADFSSPKDLADYLHKLDQDDNLYNQYFKPREQYLCYNLFASSHTWPCHVCNKVCQFKQNNFQKTLTQSELDYLFLSSDTCDDR